MRDGLLSTRQAVAWVNKHYAEILVDQPVTLDSFYHWIYRGQIVPSATRQHGTWFEYRFSEEGLLDSEAIKRLEKKNAAGSRQEIPIVTTTDELRALEARYGNLVTADRACEIASRSGAPIKIGAIKGRKLRGTLTPVARFGNVLLFPESDVKPGRARSLA